MRKVTPAETLTHFFGAGAQAYSWYVTYNLTTVVADAEDSRSWDDATDWSCVFTMEDPDADGTKRYTVTHADVMRAIRAISGKARPKHTSDACVRACKDMIFQTDEADFDAATADEVLQVAMFGQVVYG